MVVPSSLAGSRWAGTSTTTVMPSGAASAASGVGQVPGGGAGHRGQAQLARLGQRRRHHPVLERQGRVADRLVLHPHLATAPAPAPGDPRAPAASSPSVSADRPGVPRPPAAARGSATGCAGADSITARVSMRAMAGRSYSMSSGPKHCSQTWAARIGERVAALPADHPAARCAAAVTGGSPRRRSCPAASARMSARGPHTRQAGLGRKRTVRSDSARRLVPQQPPGERRRLARQQAHRLAGLQRPDHAGHRAQHARLGARRARRRRPAAAPRTGSGSRAGRPPAR